MARPPIDTSAESAAVQRQIINAKSPAERAEMLDAMSRGVTEIAKAGIRRQHPGANEGDVMVHLLERRYGADFVRLIPDDAIAEIRRAQMP